MKLAFSIAALWAIFDVVMGKAILNVIAPVDAAIWQHIVQTVAR